MVLEVRGLKVKVLARLHSFQGCRGWGREALSKGKSSFQVPVHQPWLAASFHLQGRQRPIVSFSHRMPLGPSASFFHI